MQASEKLMFGLNFLTMKENHRPLGFIGISRVLNTLGVAEKELNGIAGLWRIGFHWNGFIGGEYKMDNTDILNILTKRRAG